MFEQGVLAGYDLGELSADLDHCLLTNVTETKTPEDIQRFADALAAATGAV